MPSIASGQLVGAALAGRYELREILGEGPVGAVWRAFDREADAEIALKVFRSRLFPDPDAREAFGEWCADARRLSHPNLLRIFGANGRVTHPFIAMQLADDGSLRRRIEDRRHREPFSLDEAAAIVRQAAAGLEQAYALVRGHGLVKPENLLLRAGAVKVADYFLAAALHASAYVAPEVASGAAPSPAADVYSLAAIAAELLTGSVPERGAAVTRARPDLPREIDALFGRCLSDAPQARLSRPTDLAHALQDLASRPAAAVELPPRAEATPLLPWYRRLPRAAWVTIAAVAAFGASAATILSVNTSDRPAPLLLGAAAQERAELARLRAALEAKLRDLDDVGKRAAAAAVAARGDPTRKAEAERLLAEAKKVERQRRALRRKLRSLKRRKAEPPLPAPAKVAEPAPAPRPAPARKTASSPKLPEPAITAPVALPADDLVASPPQGRLEVSLVAGPEAEIPDPPEPAPPPPPEPRPAAPAATRPAPEPPATATPTIFLRDGMPAPRRINGEAPAYAPSAKAAGVEGTVQILFAIRPDGGVGQIRVIRDLPILGEACVSTVRRWRFEPPRHQGRPATLLVKQAFVFKLDE